MSRISPIGERAVYPAGQTCHRTTANSRSCRHGDTSAPPPLLLTGTGGIAQCSKLLLLPGSVCYIRSGRRSHCEYQTTLPDGAAAAGHVSAQKAEAQLDQGADHRQQIFQTVRSVFWFLRGRLKITCDEVTSCLSASIQIRDSSPG